MALLFSWLHERKIHPLISRRYPLSQAAHALDALLGRQAIGKLVVLPQQLD
jgi:NADPH:quinone reductase